MWRVGNQSRPAAFQPDGSSLRLQSGRGELVNPGSVGQPRDMNWLAAYALYDSDKGVVEFQRCEYDLATAQNKIREAGLPPALAERLAVGR